MTPQFPRPAGRTRPAQAPVCHDDVCVTCSDAAVQVRILELLGNDLAVADTGAGQEQISVALVDVKPGDVVLVHAKEAIAVL